MNKPLFKWAWLLLLLAGAATGAPDHSAVPTVSVAPAEDSPATEAIDESTADSTPSLQADVERIKNWVKQTEQPVIPAPRDAEDLPAPSSSPAASASSPPPLVESPPRTYSESQQAMLNNLPAMPADSQADATEAFNAMVQQNMPLSPRQVVKLRQMIDQSQRAAVIPATVPPKPVSSTIMVNLAPGTTPPAIRLAQGYVTSLVFVDSAGSPWPVASYDLGNAKANSIQWDGKSNVLLVQAATPYGDSDMVIRLVGLATPLTLELVSGQRVVDYRTDIHVPGFGPNSKNLPVGTGVPPTASPTLLSVLDGVGPSGATQLAVKGGGDCLAWQLGDRMYLRTRMTVLSPAWTGRMTSPDGMIAYEMLTSSSVLVSRHGEPVELKIEGF